MYCIYSNKEINENDKSYEHVIPLSLGGCNEFGIFVSKEKNNEYGSTIEGKISADIFIQFDRIKNQTKGHNKKDPIVIFKGTNNGKPACLTIKGINDAQIYDLISRNVTTIGVFEMKGVIKIELYIPLMAKIILAAGFYKFGAEFNNCADCDSLRIICDNAKDDEWKNVAKDVRFLLSFMQIPDKYKEEFEYYRKFFKDTNGSGLSFEFVKNRLIAHIGINGRYIGMLNIRCNNRKLIKDEMVRLWLVVINKEYIEQPLYRTDFDKLKI